MIKYCDDSNMKVFMVFVCFPNLDRNENYRYGNINMQMGRVERIRINKSVFFLCSSRKRTPFPRKSKVECDSNM